MPAEPQPEVARSHGPLARHGVAGLFHSGVLTAFLGGILPVWRYHIDPNFLIIGTYFLCQNLGILLAQYFGAALLRRKGIPFTLSLACAIACAALFLLAAFSPPAPFGWRMAGLTLIGISAGLLNTSVLHALTPAYELNPASILNLSGALFVLGSLLCSLFLAGTFFVYTVPSILILMAVVPAIAAIKYARTQMPPPPDIPQLAWREAVRDFKSPAAILFALLLFFQFGNEGALAGWLAIYLTQKLGVSPSTSLFLLALFWLSLLLGRIGAQWILPRVSHAKLLAGSVLAPMFACLVLLSTDNLFGAITGILLAGGGFAVILPLVAEKIGGRFPYFHPGVFNGIFSLALTGGLLAPASLGYLAHFFGIGVIMSLPLIGSVMIVILMLLILLEGRLSHKPAT
jgi:fucose permease